MSSLGSGVRPVDTPQGSGRLRAGSPFEWVPRVDLETWQRVVDQSESATFFHRPEWYQVFTRTFPATRLATTGIRLPGNRLVVLPLLEWKRVRALPGVFWSGPSLTYGGWISETRLSPDETVELMEWTVRRFANLSRIVGGTLDLYHARHCVEWHAAYERDALCHGSRNFLTHRALVDAWQRGFRRYDFNPSGGYEGTQQFKRTFGTTTLPASIVETRSRIYRSDWIRAIYHRLRSGGY